MKNFILWMVSLTKIILDLSWKRALHVNPKWNLPRHPCVKDLEPDPNNAGGIFNESTPLYGFNGKFWIPFSDFYQWPHIKYFDTFEELIEIIGTTDWKEISRKMQEYNEKIFEETIYKWRDVLNRAFLNQNEPRRTPTDFNSAMKEMYNLDLSKSDCNEPFIEQRNFNQC